MRLLHGNTSSPIEVKTPDLPPIGFSQTSLYGLKHYNVTHLVTTCNTRNRLPYDRSPHVQNPLIKDTSQSPLDLGHTHLTFEREIKKEHLTNVLLNKLM